MALKSSDDGRITFGRIVGRILVAGAVVAGLGYVARHSPEMTLAQATSGPAADACGTRLPKPPASSTTTSTSSTTSTADATTSSSAAQSSTSASTSTDVTATSARDDGFWRCSMVEGFDGTSLDRSRWIAQTTTGANFGVGGECFVDSPNNIAVSDGTLKLTVRREAASAPCPRSNNPGFTTPFTAGSIITKPAFDHTYGRFEIRARMPAVQTPGLQFTFWLWPRDLTNYPLTFGEGDGDKWANGELDALEWYSRYPYHDVPYIHYAHTYVQTAAGRWVPNDPNLTKACLVGTMSDWHTYAIEWTPTSIRMLADDKVCLENTHWTPRNTEMPGPFDKPFMVSLSHALGAIGTENQLVTQTPLPATTEIDYLKIWQ